MKYKLTKRQVLAENARIKYDYFLYQKETSGKSDKTLQNYRVV